MNRALDGEQELIVVDNASSEPPRAETAAWKGSGRLIELERNVGFGAASNAGVAEATGEATVLLNPDTELLDDGLDRLAAESLELGALVGPRVLNPDGSVQPSASGPEVGAWPWVRALVPAAIQPAALLAHTEPYRLERALDVSWLTGCCVAGSTAMLRRLGPFDPALHLFGEDVDLGLRAGAAGIRSRFDPALAGSSTTARARRRSPTARARAGARRHAQLARRRAPRLRAAARVARVVGAAAQPAPAPARQARPRTGDTARPGRRGGRRFSAARAGSRISPAYVLRSRLDHLVRGYAADFRFCSRVRACGVSPRPCPIATLYEVLG